MQSPRLSADNRLALLMHEIVDKPQGKMGFGLLRYSVAPVCAIVDRVHAGKSTRSITGIANDAPIVSSIQEASALGADTLVPAIAPAGGVLPSDWIKDVQSGLSLGMNVVNGLHLPMASDPKFAAFVKPGRFIWDIRQEPKGLVNGRGAARDLPCKRVLFVGTDMANGKMTAALEMHRAALLSGHKSAFVATGQIGIAISGDGVPLDAVRVDFATGAVEAAVMRIAQNQDVLFIEGQGSLLHPASTATLPLIRGSVPTHMILCHRAGQDTILREDWVRIPPLKKVVELYELLANGSGAFPNCFVTGISLNTGHLSESQALDFARRIADETGLPVSDPVRWGCKNLLDAIVSTQSGIL